MANLQNAGAIVLAKTNMGEFAISPLESRVSQDAMMLTKPQRGLCDGMFAESTAVARQRYLLMPAGLIVWSGA